MSDFAAYLDAADGAVQALLGGPAHYMPQEGAAADIIGMFEPALRRQNADRPGTMRTGPAFQVRLRDLPVAPVLNDQLDITTAGVVVSYRVREVETDGQGGAWLHLQRVVEALP